MLSRTFIQLKSSTFRQQVYLGLGQFAAHLGVVYAVLFPSALGFLGAGFVYFLMTSVGISITAHRYLAHRSFYLPRYFECLGSLFATLAIQGSTVAWVGMHREHHRHSDSKGDPHSPHGKLLRVHFFSMFYTPKLKYVLDLLRDPFHQWLHRRYWHLNLGYAVLLVLIGGLPSLVFLYLLPAAATWHGIGMAKTIAHKWGYRNFDSKDSSYNLPVIGYFTFGEGWHNNHHAKPKNWSFKTKWYEWDLSAAVVAFGIRFLGFTEK